MNENFERCERFVFTQINDGGTARIPSPTVKPAAFTTERCGNARSAHNAPTGPHQE